MADSADALVRSALASVESAIAAGVQLSPQASIMVDAVESLASQYAGGAVSLALGQVSDALSSAMGDVLGTVAEVADVVPVLGAMVQIIKIGIDGTSGAKAAAKAAQCRAAMSQKPVGTYGAGGSVRPCDLFNQTGSAVPGVGMGGFDLIPVVGRALATIFEADERAAALSTDAQLQWTYVEPFDLQSPMARKSIRNLYNQDSGAQIGGCPAAVRVATGQLRKAIAAQYGVHGSDGGVFLWPAYLDCLLFQVDHGFMDLGYASYLLNVKIGWNGSTPYYEDLKPACDWTPAAEGAMALVDGWRNTLHPTYADDIATQKRMVAAAKAAMPVAVEKVLHPPSLGSQRAASRAKALAAAGAASRASAARAAGKKAPPKPVAKQKPITAVSPVHAAAARTSSRVAGAVALAGVVAGVGALAYAAWPVGKL